MDGVISAFGFKPFAPKYGHRAAREIWDAMKNGRFSQDMKEWRDFGGFQSLLAAQEISDVNNTDSFKKLKLKPESMAGQVKDAALFLPKTYLDFTRNMTDFREGILRFATYLYCKDMLKASKDGLPKFYGASIPARIRGLESIEERAYQMSNDALGAYDEVTEMGAIYQAVSHTVSFLE